MERQVRMSLVATNSYVGLPVDAKVSHVAEHLALRVLRERGPELRAQAPVDECCVGPGIAVHRQATQQRETAAVL